jgi:hypothetical protein
MDGSSKARVWISASAHYGRDDRALGPRAIMHIDQLRSQESFSAHFSLSLAVNCALYKLLYKIYALTYVSISTYTTKVRFKCSLAAIYWAHTTHRVLSVRCKAPCAAGCACKWRADTVPRGLCAQLGYGARAAELWQLLVAAACSSPHRQLQVPSPIQSTNGSVPLPGRTCHD